MESCCVLCINTLYISALLWDKMGKKQTVKTVPKM